MRSFKISVLAGHTHIVKILAPLTDNPNAPTKWGDTPYSVARDAKIQEILESFNLLSTLLENKMLDNQENHPQNES